MQKILPHESEGSDKKVDMNREQMQKPFDVWMEVKIILAPNEYHALHEKAEREALNASEFAAKIIHRFIEKESRQ